MFHTGKLILIQSKRTFFSNNLQKHTEKMTLLRYEKSSPGARSYRALALELIEILNLSAETEK